MNTVRRLSAIVGKALAGHQPRHPLIVEALLAERRSRDVTR